MDKAEGPFSLRLQSDQLVKLARLFGVPEGSEECLPQAGQIVLIRGAPGSGKTTLGLQLLQEHRRGEKDPFGLDFVRVFVSLEHEEKPTRLRLKRHYSSSLDSVPDDGAEDKNWVGISRPDVELALARLDVDERRIPSVIANLLLSGPESKVRARGEDDRYLIFVDSLNILAEIVLAKVQDEFRLRGVFQRLADELRKKGTNAIVLMSGEYHVDARDSVSQMAESFFCDAEILLWTEPVAGRARTPLGARSGVGYTMDVELPNPAGEQGRMQTVESRSFCRVLKNRSGMNQSRRCAYDIVPVRGFEFFETYPGDGHLVLFAENAVQKQLWEDFRALDLRQLYPALRFDVFDRRSMDQTFAVTRRTKMMPPRTDLHLASFDTHWVGQLCARRQRANRAGCLLP